MAERENVLKKQMAARQHEKSKAIFVVRTLEPVKSQNNQGRSEKQNTATNSLNPFSIP